MSQPRRIRNSNYAINIDIVEESELETYYPELGALLMTTSGKLFYGNGEGWLLITGR